MAIQPSLPADAAVDIERRGLAGVSDERLLAAALGDGPGAAAHARRLLDAVGGLSGVARSDPAELAAAGAEQRSALALLVGIEVARRVAHLWPQERWVVRTPSDVAERLLPAMAALDREELRVLLLDTKNTVSAARTVYLGNVAGTSVRVGEIYREAVRACAAGIMVVHNHPSGDPTPSADDLRITAELAEAGRLLDIDLVDHLIIGRGRWVSLRALGVLGQGRATMR